MPGPLRIKAFAKVNLFLEIVDRRSDGYHLLSTVFQTISLADELTLRPAETLELSCSDPALPTDETNLAMRAAVWLKAGLGEKKGAAIHLDKKTPMGAGLGGGSSDAAAVLTGLSKLWRRQPAGSMLIKGAGKLGADVAFFLKGGTCAAAGIGDNLKPLPKLAKTWLVLVYPGFGVSTKEAYSKVKVALSGKRSLKNLIPLLAKPRPHAWVGELFNRFEEFIFPDHPELPQLKRELVEAGALGALMSGSGSSVFGVVENEAQGRKIWSGIRKKYPQSWLVHTV